MSKQKAISIINSYGITDREYAQTLSTILFNSTFDTSSLIVETEADGKRLAIKPMVDDYRDEYTKDDIIVV